MVRSRRSRRLRGGTPTRKEGTKTPKSKSPRIANIRLIDWREKSVVVMQLP